MRCARCKAEKPEHDFPRNKRTTSGRHCYCKPCHNAQNREARERAGGSRRYHLKKRYGITMQEFDGLLEQQGSLCPICLKRPAVHVDHDHSTGNVRGILCEMCNGGLGQFRDNPATIERAIEYLEQHGDGGA